MKERFKQMSENVITKAGLIHAVNEIANEGKEGKQVITQEATARVINAMINAIADSVAEGKKVELARFGSFVAVERAKRKGRNPSNGETIIIPAKKVPVFRPGKNFKKACLAK